MKTPDRIATIAIATVAAVLVTVAGFALSSGGGIPDDGDLPTIATAVDPSATPSDTPVATDPIVPDAPMITDDDDDDDGDDDGDDYRETVTRPVRVEGPDDDADDAPGDDDDDDEDDDQDDDEDDDD
ncbi:MAG: hypothetical protein Q7W44_01615 [Coriobacteriia bacterium]|nr:hypothetical protein [Coriobacteriia bacterium]